MGKNNKRKAGRSNAPEDRKRRKEAEEKWKNAPRADAREDSRGGQWTTEFSNKRFEAFYKAQHFINEGEDWELFLKRLVEPLPACFRIASNYQFADTLRKELLSFVSKEIVVNDKTIHGVEQLPWYPNGCGYKLDTDRRTLRKVPELTGLHQWMIKHTENGNITRQEAVSMVPPVALDVHPHHKCLDMCASPGSKTSQILEVIDRSTSSFSLEQQGLVVANDADVDRSYMLVHQCRRINSPFLVVTNHQGQTFPTIKASLNQYKSEFFDRVLCDVPCGGDGTLRKNPTIWNKWSIATSAVIHPLQLTIAKRGIQVLKTGGLMVYSTCSMSPYEDEAVIAELLRTHRGKLELVDAREFMPLFKARPGLQTWTVLEDSAVIQKEAHERKKSKRELKQQHRNSQQQQQQQEEGKETSEVQDTEKKSSEEEKEEVMETEQPTSTETENKEEKSEPVSVSPPQDFSHIADEALRNCLEMGMNWFRTFEDIPENLRWKYRPSLFPPTKEELEWMHLEKCLRCVPQDENTGGFFVATLRKISSSSSTTANSNTAAEEETAEVSATTEEQLNAAMEIAQANLDDEEGGNNNDKKNNRNRGKQQTQQQPEVTVRYLPWDAESFEKMKEFYNFDESIEKDDFYIREDSATLNLIHNRNRNKNQEQKAQELKPKTIYYVPKSVQSLLNGDVNSQLKIVTTGIKVFEKKTQANGSSDYRLLQDCIKFLAPHIHSNRKVYVPVQDFCNIMGGGLVSYATLSKQTLQTINSLSNGVIICVYKCSPEDVLNSTSSTSSVENNSDAPYEFSAVCWKGFSPCINVMVNRTDLELFRHQLSGLNVFRLVLPPFFTL
jgi:multisite-specific tRNA:(cytosine-C5)-methyltransferase